jgi:hypothetical protein
LSVLNQLQFCHQAYLDYSQESTPIAYRQSQNALLFANGVLFEALLFSKNLGQYFRNYKSFQKGFATFSPDRDSTQPIVGEYRNRLSFHVDTEPIVESLKTLKVPKLYFLTASGSQRKEIYFQLADEIAINFVIGEHPSKEEEFEHYKKLLQNVMETTAKFVNYGYDLIWEYIERKRWVAEPRNSI